MKLLIIMLSLIFLCGCEKQEKADIFAMDTIISLEVYGKSSETAMNEMRSEIKRLDEKFKPDSDFSDDAETKALIKKADEISDFSYGSFDIRLGEVMKLWGFRDKNYRIPTESEIDAALSEKSLDFGGIAKGYAGDRLREICEENGIESGVLTLGGNVVAIGKRTDGNLWRVGIAHPENSSDYVGYVEVLDKSVVTSGGYQRYFEKDGKRYHHIIDPKTGKPSESDLLSVTVISKDGTLADALSTAFFVLGKEKTIEIYNSKKVDFEAVLINLDGEITVTDNANFTKIN